MRERIGFEALSILPMPALRRLEAYMYFTQVVGVHTLSLQGAPGKSAEAKELLGHLNLHSATWQPFFVILLMFLKRLGS